MLLLVWLACSPICEYNAVICGAQLVQLLTASVNPHVFTFSSRKHSLLKWWIILEYGTPWHNFNIFAFLMKFCAYCSTRLFFYFLFSRCFEPSPSPVSPSISEDRLLALNSLLPRLGDCYDDEGWVISEPLAHGPQLLIFICSNLVSRDFSHSPLGGRALYSEVSREQHPRMFLIS